MWWIFVYQAVRIAQRADVVVAVLGESWNMSGEAASRTSINLPVVQTDLLREIKQTGKPVVLVLMNGRPVALEVESQLADAIIETWYSGTERGRATADILFGKRNPSGKLPVTVTVTNVGDNDGTEVVQLCLRDLFGSVTWPVRKLKAFRRIVTVHRTNAISTGNSRGQAHFSAVSSNKEHAISRRKMSQTPTCEQFRRIELKQSESRKVTFTIDQNTLRFLRRDRTWGTEPGTFRVFVGPNSRDVQSAQLVLTDSLIPR